MKVNIKIENGNYCKSVKNGKEFTSVSYDGKSYGGASPCDTPEEIERAITHAIKTIENEGDIPIVNRTKQIQLFGGNYA